MLRNSLLLVVALLTVSALGSQLFPYNIDGQAGYLGGTEDGCTSDLANGQQFRILNETVDFMYVCTNGVVSFRFADDSYENVPFPVSGHTLVTPFWADASTVNNVGGDSARVYYEMIDPTSSEAATLIQLVRSSSPFDAVVSQFTPTRIYQATWNKVGYYNAHPEPYNTFQVAILTDESKFYAIFNYPEGGINWLLADYSGHYPVAGVNLGDGVNHISLPFSGANIASAMSTSNVGVPGIWVVNFDELPTNPPETASNPPSPSSTPSPGQLFPFNIDGQAGYLSGTEDTCTWPLDGQYRLFGESFTSVHVCTNGFISFGYPDTSYNPTTFPVYDKNLVAPFWADVSIVNNLGGDSGRIYYEMIPAWSNEATKLNGFVRATDPSNPAISQFTATRIYQATWNKVGYYNAHPEPHNSFQAVIITDETRYFAIFNYPEGGINWILPEDANTYPVAGANLGDGVNFITLPFSGENIASATTGSNIGVTGVWVINIGEADVPQETPTLQPTKSQSASLPYNAMVYRNSRGKSNNLGYAISASGNQVVVGQPACPEDFGYDKACGKVYLLDTSNGGWELVQFFQYLGKVPGSAFGSNVLLQDGWLLIQSSAMYDASTGTEQSVVYGFRYSPSHGRYIRKFSLSPPTSQYMQFFGGAFAVDGNYTIITSKWASTDGYSMNGIAYVYQYPKSINRTSGPRYLAVTSPYIQSYDVFGQSVAARNGILLVSTSSVSNPAVYVYNYDISSSTHTQTITPSSYYSFYFGNKIIFDGVDLFVGAYLDSNSYTNGGSVYHFTQNPDGAFSQQEIFTPYDQMENMRFGVSIAYDSNEKLLVVGATEDYKCDSCTDKGAVYTLKKSVFGYWEQTKHALGKADGSDNFGYSVSASAHGVLVGAPYDNTHGPNRGAIYMIHH